MQQEVDLGGTIYISSKRAAEITGYTQDYIGQLARAQLIRAQRISGLWYVNEESLRNYKANADEFKPEPPPPQRENEMEAAVSFDGRDYVSAGRAAKITGYAQDYVGQLARSGKILSRQIGNRWYVDREGIVAHKKHNDALLAAVQAESVGLQKEPDVSEVAKDEGPHFQYYPEVTPIVPELEKLDKIQETQIHEQGEEPDIVNEIPIRVIRPRQSRHEGDQPEERAPRNTKKTSKMAITSLIVVLAIGGISGGAYAILGRAAVPNGVLKGTDAAIASSYAAARGISNLNHSIPRLIANLFSKELNYHRDSF